MIIEKIKRHLGSILFFSAIIFIFLGKLIFMKAAFLGGDYLVQFYPWSKVYSEAIKNFTFPFWTRYIGSGFPLMAEGQIGGFYPLNLIMFFFLPFNIAYNYSIVLHFVLAGIFTYIYAREIGADTWGGALAALVFCFGSGYAGCFYNTVTVKTLIWFPMVLFLIEKYFENKRNKYLIYSGIILGMQLLAGFAQVAIYSAFFYLLYFIYGLISRKNLKLSDIIKLLGAFILAIVIFYPQFTLSWRLAGLSPRANSSLGFSLWGSFSPLNLMSICFPSSVFNGARFYTGVFTILFLIAAFYSLKNESRIRPLFIMLLVSIFLALGAYNPFYVILLKLTKFYSFRNPSKLLFFGIFSVSVLSGFGFTKFFTNKEISINKKFLKTFCLFLGIMLGIFAFAKLILVIFKDAIIKSGEWYVLRFIAGKEYHRYDIIQYLERVKDFYQQFRHSFSLGNIFTAVSFIFCVIALLLCVYIYKKGKNKPFYKPIFIAAIFIDLFVFSFYGTGFRGNIRPFESLRPAQSKILTLLQSDKEVFRILPFDLSNINMPWWLKPNANILFGLDTIALYTPLVQHNYRSKLFSLEIVDDSLGLLSPDIKALEENQHLLELLNVKYVVSAKAISFGFLEKLVEETGVFLYRLKEYLPKVFFTNTLESDAKEQKIPSIKIVKYESGLAEVEVLSDKEGFLIFSENYYPGWDVYVDGKEKENLRFNNIVQAVKIDKGNHKVIFKFKPKFN